MTFKIIKTGSKGNAIVIKDTILVDCGVSYTDLKEDVKNLKLVLLSHVHGDHLRKSTVARLAAERPTLRFGCAPYLVSALVECGVKKRNIDVLTLGTINDYCGAFQIIAEPLVHDVPNCSFKIIFPDFKCFYATDTENLNGISAPNYDLYLIEANYEEDEIHQRIKEKQFENEYVYEYRAYKTHLSKEKANEWLVNNAGDNSRFSYIHCHQEVKNG